MGDVIKRTRYAIMVDSVVATVVGTLIVGFFAAVWITSTGLSKAQIDTVNAIEDMTIKMSASNEVFSEEIAKLRTGIRRLESMIFEIRNAASIPNADVPTVNRVEESLQPGDDLSNPSALKIRRDVEQSIINRVKELK
jgi:hypothetical protein